MGTLPTMSAMNGRKKNLEKRKIHHMFEQNLQESNGYDKLAVIFKENNVKRNLTYGELNATANKLARSILKHIMENQQSVNSDGDYIIAVSILPSDRLLITLLAIWKCGAAYLPLDPTFPEQRIKHILKESKPVIVVHDELTKTEYFEGSHAIAYSTLMEESISNSIENIPEINSLTQKTENLAIVLYTSGSTGIPKGVRLPFDIILNRLQWQFDEFPYSPTERVCVFKTALTFVDSVCEIWGPLINSLTILVIPKNITRDPQKLAEELHKYKVERLVLVPSLLRSLLMYLSLSDDKEVLSSLKLWISSGEPLTVSLAREFFKHFSSNKGYILCNFYGSTEIMGDVTYCSLTSEESLLNLDKIPIGIPIDNTIIYLLDEYLTPVPMGNTGELWVSGCNLAAGYVNGRDPDRFILNTMSKDPAYSRLYRTGDFAKIENDTIFYEGRTDSQIKIRGHRVDLAEVEKAVLSTEGVEKGVVLCYKPGEMDQALLAFVTSEPGKNVTGLKIERELQEQLAAYMIPQVIFLDTIPLLVNGKVDRQALLKMYENTNNNDDTEITLDIDYSGVTPLKMKAAEVLFETVGSIIGRSARHTLSLTSNYYELGGNSLNSIYTISQLREQGYIIGITDFITAKNLGEVLDRISNGSNDIYNLLDGMTSKEYSSESLNDVHKEECLKMIVSSFYEKAELEQLLKAYIKEQDYFDLLEKVWSLVIEKGFSFVVKSQSSGKLVGVALNFDLRDEPEVMIESGLMTIFEFLEYLEKPMRDLHLPMEIGKIIHSFMMATHSELSTQENVSVIHFMEEEIVSIAKRKGFQYIFTTNTSPLTQQLATDVMGYEILMEYQLNHYTTHSGWEPFSKAPDSQTATVCLKRL